MTLRALLLAATLSLAELTATAATASLTRAQLAGVEVAPTAGTVVPRQAEFRDLSGKAIRLGDILGRRPALLVLADYDCHELCGPILSIVSRTLSETGLHPGQDFDLVVVGLNVEASLADAAAMKAAQVDGFGELSRAAYMLTGTRDAIASLEQALHYRAVYDADAHRFAHPSDVFLLTREGALSRMLPGLALDPSSLRLALVEAGQGRIGTLGDRLHFFCYGLDPATGKATRAVQIILIGGGLLTIGGLAFWLARARPRHGPIREGGSA